MSVDSVRAAWPLFQEAGGGSIPTSTLQLRIYEISVERAAALNAYWHSVLPDTTTGNLVRNKRYVFYGAEYGGKYFAVAIWTDPVAANRLLDGWNALELRRLAIAPDAPRNTASRMLAVMGRLIRNKWPELNRLISYQSIDHHKGTIYRAAGWQQSRRSEFVEWSSPTTGRLRTPPQITSSKVRWERQIA